MNIAIRNANVKWPPSSSERQVDRDQGRHVISVSAPSDEPTHDARHSRARVAAPNAALRRVAGTSSALLRRGQVPQARTLGGPVLARCRQDGRPYSVCGSLRPAISTNQGAAWQWCRVHRVGVPACRLSPGREWRSSGRRAARPARAAAGSRAPPVAALRRHWHTDQPLRIRTRRPRIVARVALRPGAHYVGLVE